MNDLVAKRYVKALVEGRKANSVLAFSKNLDTVVSAFNDEKFKTIISSPEVKDTQKVDLILPLVSKPNVGFENFIRFLGEKRRLTLLPEITKELKKELARINNSYEGVIYTNSKLTKEYISSIEDKFSKKFNVKLSLSQSVGDYDGIKVDIDDLGVEIAFSKERFESQIINHILQAV